jgi:hypothetical protein
MLSRGFVKKLKLIGLRLIIDMTEIHLPYNKIYILLLLGITTETLKYALLPQGKATETSDILLLPQGKDIPTGLLNILFL